MDFMMHQTLLSWTELNKRLHRQGQKKAVMIHHIMCEKTLNEAQALTLMEKETTQTNLRKAVKAKGN